MGASCEEHGVSGCDRAGAQIAPSWLDDRMAIGSGGRGCRCSSPQDSDFASVAPQEERRAATALASLSPDTLVGRLVSCLCEPDDIPGAPLPIGFAAGAAVCGPRWFQGTVVRQVAGARPPRWLVRFVDGDEGEIGVRSDKLLMSSSASSQYVCSVSGVQSDRRL